MTAKIVPPRGRMVEELEGVYEAFPLPADQMTLLSIFGECFEEWEHIHIGSLIQGAVWEIRPPIKPHIAVMDGYATVDFEAWHMHVCIGEHTGSSPELAKIRQTSRAELYRTLTNDVPTAWGLRLYNGADQQQITFFLPHPFLTDDQQVMKSPDWDRLALWDRLRRKYLSYGLDPVDRSLERYVHG